MFGRAELQFDLARGRVMQATVSDQAAYWNPAVRPAGWNVGGDRLWLGREIDWFWTPGSLSEPQRYVVQESLDPGSWNVLRADEQVCTIEQSTTVRNWRTDELSTFLIKRTFQRAPLGKDVTFGNDGLAYETRQTLEILSGPPGQQVGFWSLIQVPLGGVARVACREGRWRSYFDGFVPEHTLSRTAEALEFSIRDNQKFKVGLGPGDVIGPIIYTRLCPQFQLTIRRTIAIQPLLPYVDVPRTAVGTEGDAVQIYGDGGKLGHFGELEHHSPAVAQGDGGRLTESYLTEVFAEANPAKSD